MKTAIIKIKNYTGNTKIIDSGNLQKKIFDFMLLWIGVLALCYFVFLSSMVWNIVERKSLENYANTLLNEVGTLELQYLSESEKVDLALAHSLGFKEIKAKYATRKALGSMDILNNEI